jgi:hypothetical protein
MNDNAKYTEEQSNQLAVGAFSLLERVNITGKEAESYLMIKQWLASFQVVPPIPETIAPTKKEK